MADIHRVEQWLVALGRVTAARLTPEAAADFVDKFATMLAGRFPDETFTPRSVEHVAAECRFLPTYGEIVAHLRSLPSETPPRRDNVVPIRDDVVILDPNDRHWLNHWHAREAENFVPLRESDGRLSRPDIKDWRAHTESLVRTYAPNAWDYILATQRGAA